MYLSFEITLWIGIFAFYIFGSTKFVYKNEFFILKGFKAWSFVFPSSFFIAFKKKIYIPNLFLPHLIHLQFSYPSKEEKFSSKLYKEINNFCKILLPLQILTVIQFLLLCIVLPLMILYKVHNYYLLCACIFIYMIVIVEFIYQLIHQKELGVNKKKIYSIFFGNLLCPPFSLNIIREISYISNLDNRPITLSKRFLKKNKMDGFRVVFENILCKELENVFLNKQEKNKLIKYKKML
jgi:hypothetical protein